MSGTCNLSIVFWIWLIFLLGLKIKSISCSSFKTDPECLEIPALGRISHGIGSLYDGRTGNFLPLEFSVISEKTRLALNPQVIRRKPSTNLHYQEFPIIAGLSDKLLLVFGKPKSKSYDVEFGLSLNNYGGLALQAVLGMLEFPENGTGGCLLDSRVTQEEMTDVSTSYSSSYSESFEDELILPGKNPQNLERDKLLKREIRRSLKRADIKILKRATHVVVKVIRGSKTVESKSASSVRVFSDGPLSTVDSSSNSSSVSNSTLDSSSSSKPTLFSLLGALKIEVHHKSSTTEDEAVSPAPLQGVPLSFELMPLLQFLDKSGLQLTPSSRMKFKALEDSSWRDPMDIPHGRTFTNLDWTSQLTREMLQLKSTLHQCLQENPGKDKERAGEIIQELQNLYDNFTQKLNTYKMDLKSHLENSSSGTEQDEKLWDSIYQKPDGAVGTGIHWNFFRELETTQEKVWDFGGENNQNNKFYDYSKFLEKNKVDGKKVKIGCAALPEIVK